MAKDEQKGGFFSRFKKKAAPDSEDWVILRQVIIQVTLTA